MKSIVGVCALLVLFMFGVAGSAVFWDKALLVYAHENENTRSVSGEIIDYKIERNSGTYGNRNLCEVRYYYSLDGESFISKNYRLSGKLKPSKCEDTIESGSNVTVHYIPSAPGISYVHGGTREPMYLFFAFFFALILSLIGGGYILFRIFADQKKAKKIPF